MLLVGPVHLLQEDDVDVEGTQALARLVQHHALVEVRQALVDVVGGDAKLHQGTFMLRLMISSTMPRNCFSDAARAATMPINGGRSNLGCMRPA